MNGRDRTWALTVACAFILLVGAASINTLFEIRRGVPHPSALTRWFPGVSNLYSRGARGTWNVNGPADRIDMPNGRRYYLDLDPQPVASPDLRDFVAVSNPVWPDLAWYIESGKEPDNVWAKTRNGSYWHYGLSGGW